MDLIFDWKRYGGYYVDSQGDRRFSAFNAMMDDGRTLECHYQCDVKGWDPGGTHWRLGKGRPPKQPLSKDVLWDNYLALWRRWINDHIDLFADLRKCIIRFHQETPSLDGRLYLSDRFATTPINQAHALAVLLNEREQC